VQVEDGAGSSEGSGVVFVSLVQNLIHGEPGSNGDGNRLPPGDFIFTTD